MRMTWMLGRSSRLNGNPDREENLPGGKLGLNTKAQRHKEEDYDLPAGKL